MPSCVDLNARGMGRPPGIPGPEGGACGGPIGGGVRIPEPGIDPWIGIDWPGFDRGGGGGGGAGCGWVSSCDARPAGAMRVEAPKSASSGWESCGGRGDEGGGGGFDPEAARAAIAMMWAGSSRITVASCSPSGDAETGGGACADGACGGGAWGGIA